jgi:hypothetical protein
VTSDTWVNWQAVATREQQEVFDAGTVGTVRVRGSLSLGWQFHEVHHGGQINESGYVSDSFAAAAGLLVERKISTRGRLRGELYGVGSIFRPRRSEADTEKRGNGVVARVAFLSGGWRAHVLVWRGHEYLKEEGDPLYQSRYEAGTFVASTRHYEEYGLLRVFEMARGMAIEASARLHHIEDRTEYSYRLVGRFDLRRHLGRNGSPDAPRDGSVP